MLMPSRPGRAYKEITLQQLRSFCETVWLGGLTAADSLGLARPTVWKQVHALEHHLGVQLVAPHTQGCESTEAGRLLANIASPLVTGIGSIKQALQFQSQSAPATWRPSPWSISGFPADPGRLSRPYVPFCGD